MSQIVKTKKKGRPSKADLAARRSGESPAEQVRRSLRRRNVKYTIDYDDYLDYDSDYSIEADEEILNQKKLKLMTKLHPEPPPPARESHALESESESESEDERKPMMKKQLPVRKEESEEEEEEEYEGNEEENEDGEV